jgi:hypothetical protein
MAGEEAVLPSIAWERLLTALRFWKNAIFGPGSIRLPYTSHRHAAASLMYWLYERKLCPMDKKTDQVKKIYNEKEKIGTRIPMAEFAPHI